MIEWDGMVHLHKGTISFTLTLINVIVILLMSSASAAGWKFGVKDQDETCYLYTHETKTCFMESHVNGRAVLQLQLTPTTPNEYATPPDISWFRRVKLRNKHSLAVTNLLDRGRLPSYMFLSENKTELIITILSEYDMSRNSFKARIGGREKGDYQNFVIESEPVDIEEPERGSFVAINTMDYFTIPGRNAHFDWSKEGARHLPRNIEISHDGKRMLIRHYLPAEDYGVYVCEVYSPSDYFIAGRRFILGSAGNPNSDSFAQSAPPIDNNEHSGNTAPYEFESPELDGPWVDDVPDLDAAPLSINEIVHIFKNNGDVEYILNGKTQYLACLPSNMVPVDKLAMGLIFTWYRPKDSDVILTFDPARYLTIDGGKLEISNVGPKDSGALECNVKYHGDTGKTREKIFTYRIEVYTLPDLVYSVSSAYTADSCSLDHTNSVFAQQLGAHLQSSIVSDDTSYEITNFVADCNDTEVVLAGGGSIGSASSDSYTVRVSFDVVTRHGMVSQCSIECMVGQIDTKMRLIGMKLGAFFSREYGEGLSENKPFRLIPDSVRIALKYRCEVGYGLHASICVSCKPGSHSKFDSTECSQCPVGTYQAAYGAVDCTECPAHESTYWSGAISVEQCQVKTVIMGSIIGTFCLIVVVGLLVSCILFRIGKHRRKPARLPEPLTAVILSKTQVAKTTKDVAPKQHVKFTKPKKSLSVSDIAIPGHESELEVLLHDYRSDDTVAAVDDIQSQQRHHAPVADQTGHGEDSMLLQYGSQEPRQELPAYYEQHDYGHTPGDNVVQQGDVHISSGGTYQDNTFSSYLPDSREQYHHTDQDNQQREDPFDHGTRSRTVTGLVPIEQQHSVYPSSHELPNQQFGESVVAHPYPPPEAGPTPKYSSQVGIVSRESLLQPQLASPSHRTSTLQPEEVHLTPKHSFHTEAVSRESPSRHHPASPSQFTQQFTPQEGRYQSERYSPPHFDGSPDYRLSPYRPASVASPSQIPMSSRTRSTSIPANRKQSISSSGPSTPRSLQSRSSESDLPGPLIMPLALSDSDSEIEIGSFMVEGDTIPGRREFQGEESFQSMISRQKPSPGRGSVAALIASYQSLPQDGPRPTHPPPAHRLSDMSSSRFSSPGSRKKSSVSILGISDTSASTKLPKSPTMSPRTITGHFERTLSLHSYRAASPDSYEHFTTTSMSPPHPPGTPTSSKSALMMLSASPPPFSTTGPDDLEQSVHSHGASSSIAESIITEQISIRSLSSSPIAPQIDPARTLTPTGSNDFSSVKPSPEKDWSPPQSATLPPDAPSIQRSSKDSLMTRRSSLITSPSGRPVNPFELQRLRRQSLAAQESSHLMEIKHSTSTMESSTLLHTNVPPPPPLQPPPPSLDVAAPTTMVPPTITIPPTVAPPTIDPPLTVATPPAIAPPPNLVSPTTPAAPNVTFPPIISPPPVSDTLPADMPPPTVGAVPPPPLPPPPPPTGVTPTPAGAPPSSVVSPPSVAPSTTPRISEPSTNQSTAPPHPVAALINSAFTGRKGPTFLTSEPEKKASTAGSPALSEPVAPVSISRPPGGSVSAIPAPPPPPPPPPVLEE